MAERAVLPLVANFGGRRFSDSGDPQIKNGIVYTGANGEVFVEKRPGLGWSSAWSETPAGNGGHGVYHQEIWDYFYAVVDSTMYRNGSAITMPGTFSIDNLAMIDFTEDENGNAWLKPSYPSTAKLYYIAYASNGTEVTDVDFPSTTIRGVIYIDGYILVAQSNGRLWNSNVGAGSAWTALDYVTAEIEADVGVCLIKHHNHAAVLGSRTIEFFSNQSLPVGSPFLRREDLVLHTGCGSAWSVATYGDTAMFVASDTGGERYVALMEDFRVVRVSNPEIERQIRSEYKYNLQGYFLHVNGKLLYLLGDEFVYDLDAKLWYRWTKLNTSSVESAFDVRGVTSVTSSTGSKTYMQFDDGQVYEMTSAVGYDLNSHATNQYAIKFDVILPPYSGPAGAGGMTKMCRSAQLVGQHRKSGDTSAATLSYSDDDMVNWTTAGTWSEAHPRSKLVGLGAFWERSFRIVHEGLYPFKARALEVDIDVGSS